MLKKTENKDKQKKPHTAHKQNVRGQRSMYILNKEKVRVTNQPSVPKATHRAKPLRPGQGLINVRK